jgi:hypothetical protein
MTYDPFAHFPPKPYHDPRDPLEWRAVIRTTEKSIKCVIVFPPTQLKSMDNKYEFNRHLIKFIDGLKARGATIDDVDLAQGEGIAAAVNRRTA